MRAKNAGASFGSIKINEKDDYDAEPKSIRALPIRPSLCNKPNTARSRSSFSPHGKSFISNLPSPSVFCDPSGLNSFARYGLLIWVPVHLMGSAYKDSPSAVWIGVALPVGMALGALSTGYMSDKLFGGNRSRPIAMLMTLAMLVLFLVYITPPEWLGAGIVLLFLSGFLVYGPHSCYWALCPDLMGRHRAGTATGVMNFWAYMVAAATGPIIGYTIDNFDTTVLFLLLSASCALGALVILPIRR